MTAQESDQCHRCQHRSAMNVDPEYGDYICCLYILDERRMRGCPVENCDKFIEGKPKRRMENSIWRRNSNDQQQIRTHRDEV